MSNAGQGSTGNVISALASLIIPGLGQLVQGRLFRAAMFFFMALFLDFFLGPVGALAHLWACVDAALYKPSAG